MGTYKIIIRKSLFYLKHEGSIYGNFNITQLIKGAYIVDQKPCTNYNCVEYKTCKKFELL